MLINGKIIKGIGGFYYVDVTDAPDEYKGLYECRAKGIFRKEKLKPLVGDTAEIEVISAAEKTGNVTAIFDRQNELIRPAVANVDQALVIFAAKKPAPNLNLLDRFLLMMCKADIPTVICFNKTDLVDEGEVERLRSIYEKSGCTLLFTSAKKDEHVAELRSLLIGKTTTVAGPSGVGKSSLINAMIGEGYMQTGSVSEKIDRGKHTTRHSELIAVDEGSYIMDTPGFSSLWVEDMEKEDLKEYMPEFYPYEGKCRFLPCTHTHEPDCAVKEAVEQGEISCDRYEGYLLLYDELKNKKKY